MTTYEIWMCALYFYEVGMLIVLILIYYAQKGSDDIDWRDILAMTLITFGSWLILILFVVIKIQDIVSENSEKRRKRNEQL